VATAFGLLISCFTSTQIAAIFTTTILTLVIGINFSGLLVPFLSLTGAALWHCRRHPITVVCRPRCAACAALPSDAVIHRRERPLRNLSRRAGILLVTFTGTMGQFGWLVVLVLVILNQCPAVRRR
jgi:hypothetical protein